MKITELLKINAGDDPTAPIVFNIQEVITELEMHRGYPKPDMAQNKKEYLVKKHDVLDPTKRPDKLVEVEGGGKRTERVNRLAFPLQKIIVGKAVQFLFGNPVKLNCQAVTDKEKAVLTAVDRILYDNKIDSFNRKIARAMFRCSEVAEYWYSEKAETHSDYGFPCQFRIKVAIFNPWWDELLFPWLDEHWQMKAFSRDFVYHKSDTMKVRCFEVHTDEESMFFQFNNNIWEQVDNTPIIIGKIPVVYGRQEEVEWAEVQPCIERLEYLLSNFADTNDYHSSPKIFIQGKIVGFSKKGEAGAILEGEKDSTAQYLSWQDAPAAVKLEIETLLRFIYSFTQTPDVSFDSVKGLQAISGEALKMLFMDAHLKVQEKLEVFDEYLQRRINIVKAFVGKLNTGLAEEASFLRITPEVEPYMIDDENNVIKNLVAANGNKPIISQQASVVKSGLTDDPEADWKKIQEEAQADNVTNIFGTGN